MSSITNPFVAASFLLHALFVSATPLLPIVTGPGPVLLEAPQNTTASVANETIIQSGTQQPIQQNVYLHVITADNKTNITGFDSLIQSDVSPLNRTFSSSGISFNIVSEDHVLNEAWFNALPGSAAEKEMKSSLHRGGYADLNVYFVNGSITTMGKACTPPSSNPTAEEKTLDGCSIGYSWNQNVNFSLKPRSRGHISFGIGTGGGSVSPISSEIGRWLAIDIDVSTDSCFDSNRNSSSLCVYEQAASNAGGSRSGVTTTIGISHEEKCFSETSPVLCIDSTGRTADVEARMERAVLYGIGSAHADQTTSTIL